MEYGLRGQAFRYQEKLDERRSRGVTPEETPPTADVHIRVVPGSEHTAAKMLVESGATLVRYSLAEDQPANSGFSLQWNGSGQSGTHEGFRRRYGRYPYLKSGMYPLRVSRDIPHQVPLVRRVHALARYVVPKELTSNAPLRCPPRRPSSRRVENRNPKPKSLPRLRGHAVLQPQSNFKSASRNAANTIRTEIDGPSANSMASTNKKSAA